MNEEKGTIKGMWCGGGRRRWFLIPFVVIAMVLLLGAVVMWLWNAVMTQVFTSLNSITYCEAIGLLILSKILFGGFRKGGGCGCRKGRYNRGYEWKEKWMSMSEEERAKFKEEWKSRCC